MSFDSYISNAQHEISLVETGSYQVFDQGEFVFAGYGDFKTAKCNPQELKKLSFVVQAEVDLPSSKTFHRHLFQVAISRGERVLVLRTESFLRVEKRLEQYHRQQLCPLAIITSIKSLLATRLWEATQASQLRSFQVPT